MWLKTRARRISATGMLLVVCAAAGCSIHPVRTVMARAGSLEANKDIPRIRDDAELYRRIRLSRWNNPGRISADTGDDGVCRLRYHPSCKTNGWVAVTGTINDSRAYPVVLDTAASPALFVNDVHILRNKLAILPPEAAETGALPWGLCHLPKLALGGIALIDWPCVYRPEHLELQVFGFTAARDDAVILGVPALRRFSYVALDGPAKEVEISLKRVFQPAEPNLWTRHPIALQEDLAGNARLLVTVPIAERQTTIELDTGSGAGLALTEDLWNEISGRLGPTAMREARRMYPYLGRLTCRQGRVRRLTLGKMTIRDAEVSVFANESPLLDHAEAMLGMKFFRDSLLVLDFHRRLLWIKHVQRP